MPEAIQAEAGSPGVEDEGTGLVVADDGHGVPELKRAVLRGDGGQMRDTEGLEEGLINGQGDGDRAAAGDLVLDGVDVVGADGVPAGGRVLTRLAEYCTVWLRPQIGCLTVMGEDMQLRVPFPLKETEGGVIREALVVAAVELVPDEAGGEARVLVRVSFPVGDLLDGSQRLTDAGRG